MNTQLQSEDSSLPVGEFACSIGLDWGDSHHAVSLRARHSARVERCQISSRPEDIHLWLRGLADRFQQAPVAIALEASNGPVVSLLREYAWITIYPVHPATSSRYNKAFTPSGAANDQPDADNLLEILQLHRNRLRVLVPQDEPTQELEALTQLRRKLVDSRTRLCNELTSLLKNYFPQALLLIGEKSYGPMALEFLSRWPDFTSLKKARSQSLRSFYSKHRVRWPEVIEKRLLIVQEAEALCSDPVLMKVSRLRLDYLLAQLRALAPNLEAVEQAVVQSSARHADLPIFKSFPAAGPALAPRLCVLFGADRDRWHNAAELQKLYGVAPVIEASGKQWWVHWRWNAPVFHRQTLVEWAGVTVRYSAWARTYYWKQRERQKPHSVILRALAFKWLRILYRCWKERVPYDEAAYLQHLAVKGSYLAHPVAA